MKKYNLLIPIAGMGSRFLKKGFPMPKPMVLIDDHSILEWTMKCVDYSKCNVTFVVRNEHIIDYNLDGYLRNRFGDVNIVSIDGVTEGAICSCLLAEEYINNDLPLIIHCSDIYFEPQLDPDRMPFMEGKDGGILTFKSNSTNYSYAQTDELGNVVKTAEKSVISPNAAVGIYIYKKGSTFVEMAKMMVKLGMKTNNEYYICPLYNLYVQEGLKVGVQPVEKMHVFGTPEELEFFQKNTLQTWPSKKNHVALCSDHSGFDHKEEMKQILNGLGISFVDFGTFDNRRDCDYDEFVKAATFSIIHGQCNFGFGFCRSGQGVNLCANKTSGIRSGWVSDAYLAQHAIKHNCCNFFSIPSKYTNSEGLKEIVNAWKYATFDGGRHQSRISKL